MKSRFFSAIFAVLLTGCTPSSSSFSESSTKTSLQHVWTTTCNDWDEWDKPGPAFELHANTYYVGTCGIGAILITGSKGHILIDGGTEGGARLISENISSLGFSLDDVKILLHSHEHFDHVAGLAELQRRSGASLYASSAAEPVLLTGHSSPSDPQHEMHEPFPSAKVTRVVKHGEVITLGNLSLTAIATPGHTEGALSWQWESCDGIKCESIVYADSLSPISREGYYFTDHTDYLVNYRSGLEHLRQSDCTLLVTPHPSASEMRKRLLNNMLHDPNGCVNYSKEIASRLNDRLNKERIER